MQSSWLGFHIHIDTVARWHTHIHTHTFPKHSMNLRNRHANLNHSKTPCSWMNLIEHHASTSHTEQKRHMLLMTHGTNERMLNAALVKR